MALVGCLYLPHFAAWAVGREDRLLSFGPHFVHHRGIVVAASELARAAGIQRGWTSQRALSLMPDAEAIPLDTGATDYAWREVLDGLYHHTPRIETVRQGLAYFEVPSRVDGQKALADWILDLGAGCGVAESRALAELAAYHALAGAVCSVPAKSARTFLKVLPVAILASGGVSDNTVQRLEWFGWSTVGLMQDVEARHLLEQFEDGRLVARFAAAAAPGKGETAPVTAYTLPPTISARILFDEPATEPGEWEPAYDELLPRLCAQLNGREGARLTLIVTTSRGRKVGMCLLREPLREARRLREPLLDLSQSLLGDGAEIHTLEVELGSLGVHLHQEELFDNRRKRQERLLESVRLVRSRGLGEIVRAQIANPFAPFPEDACALVPWPETLPVVGVMPRRQVRT